MDPLTEIQIQLTRIADSLETLVERTEPKEVDVAKALKEAIDTLKASSPVFAQAFAAMDQIGGGDGNADGNS